MITFLQQLSVPKVECKKINTDPQELFLASWCKMRMSRCAKGCMLWFIGSSVLWLVQLFVWARLDFLHSQHMLVSMHTWLSPGPHTFLTCWYFAASLPLQSSVSLGSKCSTVCLWSWILKDMKNPYECDWFILVRWKRRACSKTCQGKCFAWEC